MNDEEINKKIEDIEKRLDNLENKKIEKEEKGYNFKFNNKKEKHNLLLKELLQSDLCYSKNGLTSQEIINIFKNADRPVVPKKIKDLLNKWVERKKIDVIKKYGESKYFWIDEEKKDD